MRSPLPLMMGMKTITPLSNSQEVWCLTTFFLTTNCIDDKELFWVSEVHPLISQTKYSRIQLAIKNHHEDFALESPHRQAAISE
jgi:hypothetical protein